MILTSTHSLRSAALAVLLCVVPASVHAAEGQPGKLVLTGEFLPMAQVKVFSRVSGIVQAVRFREGTRFKTGDVMAEIDPVEYEIGAAQSQAVLDRAAARLKAMEAGGRAEERDRARAAVDSAEAVLKNAKSNFDRMAGLLTKGGVSQQAYDQARRELDVAESQLSQARRTFDLVKVGPRTEEKDEGRAEVARCRADVALAKLKLDWTKVRAPFDGIVDLRLVDEGAHILSATSPNAPALCVFSDTATLKAMVDLPERDLPRVKVGQDARVFIQAFPGRAFPGRVANIFPFVEPKTRTVKVEIRVASLTGVLLPGMFVTAEIDAVSPPPRTPASPSPAGSTSTGTDSSKP